MTDLEKIFGSKIKFNVARKYSTLYFHSEPNERDRKRAHAIPLNMNDDVITHE